MKAEQSEILYLTGESRKVIENSPHLEAPRQKDYEVLYLSDPLGAAAFAASPIGGAGTNCIASR
jgi:HSP90 family molecular chaperone